MLSSRFQGFTRPGYNLPPLRGWPGESQINRQSKTDGPRARSAARDEGVTARRACFGLARGGDADCGSGRIGRAALAALRVTMRAGRSPRRWAALAALRAGV